MRAIYSGIDLMPLKTHEFAIQSVYDDSLTDYLFSRGTVVLEAVINGTVADFTGPFMNYRLNPIDPQAVPAGRRDRTAPVPTPFPGFAPGIATGLPVTPLGTVTRVIPTPPNTTHAAIRHRLETPRQKLYLYSGIGMAEAGIPAGSTASPATWGASVLAEAPISTGFFCDANNGPKPHLFSIKEALGDSNTYVVVWGCEFFFNEAYQNNVSPLGALLSNRFSQTHEVDEHGWTTVRTEGKAIFRTDLIYGGPGAVGIAPPPSQGIPLGTAVSPDSFRAAMFLPVGQGFIRKIDYVRGMEDVTGVEYGYTDTQVPVNFVAGPYVNPAIPGTGAASISVYHRQAVSTNNADLLSSALGAYERFAGLQANKSISDEAKKDKEKTRKKRRTARPLTNPVHLPS